MSDRDGAGGRSVPVWWLRGDDRSAIVAAFLALFDRTPEAGDT